jgi:hypothetical protein
MPDLPLSSIQGGIPNGSAAPGNPFDAEGQVLVTAPSNGADLDVSAHGLLSIDSLFDRDSASVSRSGHNQQRDWSVPVRAALSNRPDCDTITTNYEEAFGSIHPVCLRRSPIPGSGRNLVTRDGYSQFSSYSNGTPSKHQVSPTNLPSNKQGLDRMGRPTECELQNARCKPAIDETTPPIFEGSHIRSTPSVENRPQSTFKHNSIPTHPKPVSNEVSASGIQTAGNSYPSSPSALEKISAGINLS